MPGGDTALTLWTRDPHVARAADAAGVDRIGVDLERLGKSERQAGLGTWISPHTTDDLAAVANAVDRAAVFVRLNPLHPRWSEELEAALLAGAGVVMIPMFRSAEELQRSAELVAGRACVVALLETPTAMRDIDEVVAVRGIDEVHVGINDLGIALRLRSRFAVFTLDDMPHVAASVHGAGLRFGIGGIGRACEPEVRVPTDLIYAQLARLRADSTLLARSFLREPHLLAADIEAARARLNWWWQRPAAELEVARANLVALTSGADVAF